MPLPWGRPVTAIHFNPGHGARNVAYAAHLALLSDESKLMLELNESGRLISFRSLLTGFGRLKDSVPQGEGVTVVVEKKNRRSDVANPRLEGLADFSAPTEKH
ncbi:hypothetical protein FUT48_14775 [Pseudomonas sp. JG-B]|nr:hypothetical protein [Pseudomonas sp. JG-B]